METATRKHLARVAKAAALLPFHGSADGSASNLEPIVRPFPGWTAEEADGLWCAAFVYYCCREAGFQIPIRPIECRTSHLAGCIAWEEFAAGDPRIEYHRGGEGFVPEAGDIVLYDRVFENREHDHIGIVVEKREHTILAAEGNLDNRSGLIERPVDEHIRAYIRIPDGFQYDRSRGPANQSYESRSMTYRSMTARDAAFLTGIFSIPEYEQYFAENETTEADWAERIPLFRNAQSLIVSEGDRDLGWLMYRTDGPVCFIDILVLLPGERYKGCGKAVMKDLLDQNPQIRVVRLDVQQRNHAAITFYQKLGFRIISEEYQPVGDAREPYYNMQLDR